MDMRLLKFWRINSLGTIASISRTPPASAAARKGKTVEAERFVLVDASGRQRAALQVLPNGRVDLSMQDAKGGDSVKIGVEADGERVHWVLHAHRSASGDARPRE